MTTKRQLIGSVSSGTMREEDLIPAFMDALKARLGRSVILEDMTVFELEQLNGALKVCNDIELSKTLNAIIGGAK